MPPFSHRFALLLVAILACVGCGADAEAPLDASLGLDAQALDAGPPDAEVDCEDGLTACDGRCVSVEVDPANCGACGNDCPGTELCQDGRCVTECLETTCGGACVDLDNSDRHCGACDRACPGGSTCVAAMCTCTPGETLCGDRCEILQDNDRHCGACGNDCAARGETCCGTTCVSLSDDPLACGGSCDTQVMCEERQLCVGGGCCGAREFCDGTYRGQDENCDGRRDEGCPVVTGTRGSGVSEGSCGTRGADQASRCPSGTLAVGFRWSLDDGHIQTARLLCQPFRFEPTDGGANAGEDLAYDILWTGSRRDGGGFLGDPSSQSGRHPTSVCPPNSFVIGMDTRCGELVNRITGLCHRLRIQPDGRGDYTVERLGGVGSFGFGSNSEARRSHRCNGGGALSGIRGRYRDTCCGGYVGRIYMECGVPNLGFSSPGEEALLGNLVPVSTVRLSATDGAQGAELAADGDWLTNAQSDLQEFAFWEVELAQATELSALVLRGPQDPSLRNRLDDALLIFSDADGEVYRLELPSRPNPYLRIDLPPGVVAQRFRIQLPASRGFAVLTVAEVELYAARPNLALGMAARASSEVEGFEAGRSNDGDPATFAETDGTGPAEWWEVDLGAVRALGTVVVVNRGDCCQEQLNGFRLVVLDAPDGEVLWESAPVTTAGERHRIELPAGVRGRVVRVQLPDEAGVALHTAEVEVFAPRPNLPAPMPAPEEMP